MGEIKQINWVAGSCISKVNSQPLKRLRCVLNPSQRLRWSPGIFKASSCRRKIIVPSLYNLYNDGTMIFLRHDEALKIPGLYLSPQHHADSKVKRKGRIIGDLSVQHDPSSTPLNGSSAPYRKEGRKCPQHNYIWFRASIPTHWPDKFPMIRLFRLPLESAWCWGLR